jgi:hypothetical protein
MHVAQGIPDPWLKIARHCRQLPVFIACHCVTRPPDRQFLSTCVGMWEAGRIGQEGLHAAKREQARTWW